MLIIQYSIFCFAKNLGGEDEEGGMTPVKITPNTFNFITFFEDKYSCDKHKNIRCCSFCNKCVLQVALVIYQFLIQLTIQILLC